MPTATTEELADAYAAGAHANQLRKYTNEPYMLHPREVAEMVRQVRGTEAMIVAALLHDTVEDTDATLSDIYDLFGQEVAHLVYWLTCPSSPEDGNRATRKAIDLRHISRAPADAMTIKLADLLSNTRSILQHDRKFAQVYIPEVRQLHAALAEGNKQLHSQLAEVLATWK